MEWSAIQDEIYVQQMVSAGMMEHLARVYRQRVRVATDDVWLDVNATIQRQCAEQQAARVRARRQAEQLLLRLLPPVEVHRYQAHSFFHVTGSLGGLYQISHGYSGNICQVMPHHGRRYCAHPPMNVPVEAAMVSQMLMISTDEGGFLRVAIPQ